MVNAFTSLLTKKTETYAKPSHAREKMVLKQVQLRSDVSTSAVDDFTTSSGQESFNPTFQLCEIFFADRRTHAEHLRAFSVLTKETLVPLLDIVRVVQQL